MEMILSKREYKYRNVVYFSTVTREETAESVVADVLPDIGRILDTSAMATLRSKELDPGRVTVTASLGVSVIYAPEDGGGVRHVPLTIPFTAELDAPGVDQNCQCIAKVSVASVEARVLNPRKVLVRAELNFSIRCFREDTLCLYPGLAEPESADRLHLLTGTMSAVMPAEVQEKTFVITDEYRFSGPVSYTSILGQNVDVSAEDIKNVGNKLIFKGSANISLLCQDEEMQPGTVEFSSVFSQIMEIGHTGENVIAEITLACTGAYFDIVKNADGGLSVTTEIHMAAQAELYETEQMDYIADAYSNADPLSDTRETIEAVCARRNVILRDNIKVVCELTESIGETVYSSARAGTVRIDGGKFMIPVSACAIYRNADGELYSVKSNVTTELPAEQGENCRIETVDVKINGVFALAVSGGIELRVPVELTAVVVEQCSADAVIAMETHEADTDVVTPSLYVISVAGNIDIWTLAKSYHSSEKLILSANGGSLPGDNAGGILLIPTER